MKTYHDLDNLLSDVASWVATAMLSERDPQPMTVEDAAYNIACYDAEGIEYPAGMTAKMLSDAWNLEIQKAF